MSRGYLFYAIGDYWLDEAINLSKSIRKYGNDKYPISLVIKDDGIRKAKETNLFDKLIILDEESQMFTKTKLNHEKYGVIASFFMFDIAPYDETMIIDTDVLCLADTKIAWEKLTSKDQCFTPVGRNISPDWHFGHNKELSKSLGFNIPETHNGCQVIKPHHSDVPKFIENLLYSWDNYDKLGFQRKFRGGACQEINFGYASGKMNYEVIEFGEEPIMTFNIGIDWKIPTKIQTAEKNKVMYDNIPFIHMFKPHRNTYLELVKKLL
jgi:hypothetical protein